MYANASCTFFCWFACAEGAFICTTAKNKATQRPKTPPKAQRQLRSFVIIFDSTGPSRLQRAIVLVTNHASGSG